MLLLVVEPTPTLAAFRSAVVEHGRRRVTGSLLLVTVGVGSAFLSPRHWLIPFIPWILFAVAVGLFASGVFDAWKQERIRVRVLERELSTTFQFDPTYEHAELVKGDFHHMRVALRAVGGVNRIESVNVELRSITPCPEAISGYLPSVLSRAQADNFLAREPFQMNTGDMVLMHVFIFASGSNPHFRLGATVSNQIEAREYEIEISVSGSPAQAVTRRFKIGVANDRPFIKAT
jgi:hypothetical protein